MFYICSHDEELEIQVLKQRLPASPARRSGRRGREEPRGANRAEREARIVSLLNRGASIAGDRGARGSYAQADAQSSFARSSSERMPQPPAEFLALQVSRLNEALLVSFSAMHTSAAGANFEAVDRVVKIVRELDRYHGFAPLSPRSRAGN